MVKQKKDSPLETSVGVLDDGTVVIQFSNLLKEARFTPEQATNFGVGLIQWATRGDSLRRAQAVPGMSGRKM